MKHEVNIKVISLYENVCSLYENEEHWNKLYYLITYLTQ